MTVEGYFQTKGEKHLETLRLVHQIVEQIHPAIQVKIKYGIPMYVMKKNLAYLDVQKGKPIIGIVYGIHLEEIHHLLDFTGRKQIGHFSLLDLNDDRLNDLHTILYAAVTFDLNR